MLRKFLGAIALAVLIASWAQVRADDVLRVAIGSDNTASSALADTATAEFSHDPAITLVERVDLKKLGEELALGRALSPDALAAVQLLKADALVLLRTTSKNGKDGVLARLVAVAPGVVLREVVLPPGDDVLAQARALAEEFRPLWSKVAAIRQGRTVPLSLLGLRLELDAPQHRAVETSLNALLASRLSASRDVLVLERWRLNDAAFEKSLDTAALTPFWSGACLLDGRVRAAGAKVEVELRLRPRDKPDIAVKASGETTDLTKLVEALAAAITKALAHGEAALNWKPEAEAANFARLTNWCVDNDLSDEAVAAAESAVALGDRTPALQVARIQAYAMVAYSTNLFDNSDRGRAVSVEAATIPRRIEAMVRASQLAREFMAQEPVANRRFKGLQDPPRLAASLLPAMLRLLRDCYWRETYKSDPASPARLRHECQTFIQAMEPVLAMDRYHQGFILNTLALFAGIWNETPDEALAYYRKFLQADYFADTDLEYLAPGIRADFFRNGAVRDPLLDGEGVKSNTWPSEGAWLVPWHNESPEQITAKWRGFLHEMATSGDSLAMADAMKFEYCSSRTLAARSRILDQTTSFLGAHRDELAGRRGDLIFSGLNTIVRFAATSEADPVQFARQVDLYTYLFNTRGMLGESIVNNTWTFREGKRLTLDQARTLLEGLTNYAAWYVTQPGKRERVVNQFEPNRQMFMTKFPELAPAKDSDVVTLRKFWNGPLTREKLYPESQRRDQFVFRTDTVTTAEGRVWLVYNQKGGAIWSIDPASLETEAIPFPDEPQFKKGAAADGSSCLNITPEWIVVGAKPGVLLYERKTKTWRRLDLPPSNYKPAWIDGHLYLLFDWKRGDEIRRDGDSIGMAQGSGILRVNLPAGTVETLVSSRRTPPQTKLDGKPMGAPRELWKSDRGLTLGLSSNYPSVQVYSLDPAKNDWAPYQMDRRGSGYKLCDRGCLVQKSMFGEPFEQIALIGPHGIEVLVANPAYSSTQWKPASRWNFPGVLALEPPGRIGAISPIMRGDDLIFYRRETDGPSSAHAASLYYFTAGKRDALRIPLDYDVSTLAGTGVPDYVLPPKEALLTHPEVKFEALQTTPHGLIIPGFIFAGFWILPWDDIDAYRLTHGAKGKEGQAVSAR